MIEIENLKSGLKSLRFKLYSKFSIRLFRRIQNFYNDFFWIAGIFEEEEADEKQKYAHSIEFFQVVGFE